MKMMKMQLKNEKNMLNPKWWYALHAISSRSSNCEKYGDVLTIQTLDVMNCEKELKNKPITDIVKYIFWGFDEKSLTFMK